MHYGGSVGATPYQHPTNTDPARTMLRMYSKFHKKVGVVSEESRCWWLVVRAKTVVFT